MATVSASVFQLKSENQIDSLIHAPGEITGAELGEVMKSLGLAPSEMELEDLMNEIDSDRSGTISFEGTSANFSFPYLPYMRSCMWYHHRLPC